MVSGYILIKYYQSNFEAENRDACNSAVGSRDGAINTQ